MTAFLRKLDTFVDKYVDFAFNIADKSRQWSPWIMYPFSIFILTPLCIPLLMLILCHDGKALDQEIALDYEAMSGSSGQTSDENILSEADINGYI